MKIILGFAFNSFIAFGLLFWQFPWAVYYNNFSYSRQTTLRSYFLCALITSFINSLLSPGAMHFVFRHKWKIGSSLACSFLACVLFGVLSITFGPMGYDPFAMRINGIFFSEWKFFSFFLFVGIPMSILSGLTAWWLFTDKAPTRRL
jgi:hypothetical protein